MKLTYSQRKKLKALGHRLRPIVQIGKKGLTDEVVQAIDIALQNHELIKVQFLEYKDTKAELIEVIKEKTNAHVIAVIGHRVVFYRENPLKKDHVLNGDDGNF